MTWGGRLEEDQRKNAKEVKQGLMNLLEQPAEEECEKDLAPCETRRGRGLQNILRAVYLTRDGFASSSCSCQNFALFRR